eukprot:gene5975-biopygen2920
MSIAVTGANGQLGRLVVKHLVKQAGAGVKIIAAVRSPSRAADLAELGIEVRKADYTEPASLEEAFRGVSKLLLISSNEMGSRVEQHRNAIEAAKRCGVQLLVYTSLLRAPNSPLTTCTVEHGVSEEMLKGSGIPFIILRNGWYTENYLRCIPVALQHGAVMGAAGEGKISGAACEDYAEAAVSVLLSPESHVNQVYELAGDESFTLSEFAAELSAQAGRSIPYVNMSQSEYASALLGAGLPQAIADLIANCDGGACQGGLFEDGKQLSRLIGHGTTPLHVLIKRALQG